jgi:hypothetical protein
VKVIRRWCRRVLRRCGIDVPFTDVICPEHLRVIRVAEDGRTEVTVRRTLVFLDVPEDGDLRDAVPVDPETDIDSFIHPSPDAVEIGRRRRGHRTLISWRPRQDIVPYALYEHQNGWSSLVSHGQAAMYTEVRCDTRTGVLALQMTPPVVPEAAVVFKRPRWKPLASERSLVKYALRRLDSGSERALLADEGRRVEWKVVGPRVGDRYVCVVFNQFGVVDWERRLKETSIVGRLQRLMGTLPAS